MSSEKQFIKVSINNGEQVRKHLHVIGLLDGDYKIISEDGMLYLPVGSIPKTNPMRVDTKEIFFETGIRVFERKTQRPKNLAELLEGNLSEDELALLPRSYDLIGNIAVLEIPDELAQYSTLIGETFHELHRSIRTVLAKRGAITGTIRTRNYDFLSGEKSTKTIHIEYGCRLAVDVARAYFSPRLLEEHNRVAQLVKDGETVVDMFCGVGPFAIHIARQKRAKVVAIDINPSAIELLNESIHLNKLVGTIIPVVTDAHEYANTNKLVSDRIIMNHPKGASEFIGDACAMLKPGGILHYYDFVGGETPEAAIEERITGLVEKEGKTVKSIDAVRRVRDSAPHEYQMVSDIVIE
jgi:tRNA (guanine37-N1)-methyltransferase